MKCGVARTPWWFVLVPACTAVLFDQRRVALAPSVYPVSKVVDLLRQMKTQLEKEGDADEQVYEKLACWCETNNKAKTQAIADAETHLSNLQAAIEKNAALSATLKVEIEGLEREVAKNQESLEAATALRNKQKADFISEEKEMVQSIQALNAAVVVLGKHHGGAALLSSSAAANAVATVRSELRRHGDLLRGFITPRQRRALSAFLQAGGSDYFDVAPTFKQAYNPQSGEIFGILRQMQATFETDLSQSQREEVSAQEAYNGLKAAKEEEIRTGQASLQDKKEQLAKADEGLAQGKEDREDTQNSLSVDQQFLVELKQKCTMTDQEWEERQKLRQAELTAVSEAISLLSSDDARDLFSKNFNRNQVSFVQLQQVGSFQVREQLAGVLSKIATRTGSPKLSALATRVKLDTFVRVKKAIDDMVAQLVQEKAEEIRHRDLCITELNTNEKSTAKELHTKRNWESQISTLDMKVRSLKSTINMLNAEIEELNTERERARQNREAEKAEFEGVLAEQKASESLLRQALSVLESQYGVKKVGLVQQGVLIQSNSTFRAPPPGFKTHEKSGQYPGVLALLEHIIQSCQQMQQESLKAEAAARDAYTQFVSDTTRSVEAKQASIIDRTSEMSAAQQDLLQAKSELDGTVTELETLSNGLADLHSSCDYIIKNFDMRQEARDQEVEALRQAKAFLSGME